MSTAALSQSSPPKTINIALWVFQALIGAAFVMAGAMKIVTPVAELAAQQPWAASSMGQFAVAIGIVELAGGLGLILPSLTRIMPKLTVLAALGLVATMLGAGVTEVMIGHPERIAAPVVLGALCAFIAWGRHSKAPIAPR